MLAFQDEGNPSAFRTGPRLRVLPVSANQRSSPARHEVSGSARGPTGVISVVIITAAAVVVSVVSVLVSSVSSVVVVVDGTKTAGDTIAATREHVGGGVREASHYAHVLSKWRRRYSKQQQVSDGGDEFADSLIQRAFEK
jgi:hypothetical protein